MQSEKIAKVLSYLKTLVTPGTKQALVDFAARNAAPLAAGSAVLTTTATAATVACCRQRRYARKSSAIRFYERCAQNNFYETTFSDVSDKVIVAKCYKENSVHSTNMAIIHAACGESYLFDSILSIVNGSPCKNTVSSDAKGQSFTVDKNYTNLGESKYCGNCDDNENNQANDDKKQQQLCCCNGCKNCECCNDCDCCDANCESCGDCEDCEKLKECSGKLYSLTIHNPLCLDESHMSKIDAMGFVEYLIVPNRDSLGDIDMYVERYPLATVVCPQSALCAVESRLKHLPSIKFVDINIVTVESLLKKREESIDNFLNSEVGESLLLNDEAVDQFINAYLEPLEQEVTENDVCGNGDDCCENGVCNFGGSDAPVAEQKNDEEQKCCDHEECENCEDCDEDLFYEDEMREALYIFRKFICQPSAFKASPFCTFFAFSPMSPLTTYCTAPDTSMNKEKTAQNPKTILPYEYFYMIPDQLFETATIICHSSIEAARNTKSILEAIHLEDDILRCRYKEQLVILGNKYKEAQRSKTEPKRNIKIIKKAIKNVKMSRKASKLCNKPSDARRTFNDWYKDAICKKNGAVKGVVKRSFINSIFRRKETATRMADFLAALSINIFAFELKYKCENLPDPEFSLNALVFGRSEPITDSAIVRATLLAAAEDIRPGSLLRATKIIQDLNHEDILSLVEEPNFESEEEDEEECEEAEEPIDENCEEEEEEANIIDDKSESGSDESADN